MSSAVKKPAASLAVVFHQDIINSFCSGLKETIQMMGETEVSFQKALINSEWKTEGDISGIIEFDAEQFKGHLYIHFPYDVLVKIYNQMVGESNTVFTDEMMDCIGEISNMAYGVAKGKLDPLQLKFSMSLPKVSKTADLNRIPTPHLAIPFMLHQKLCQLEITLIKK